MQIENPVEAFRVEYPTAAHVGTFTIPDVGIISLFMTNDAVAVIQEELDGTGGVVALMPFLTARQIVLAACENTVRHWNKRETKQ